MFTYQETTQWNTAPEGWISGSFKTHQTSETGQTISRSTSTQRTDRTAISTYVEVEGPATFATSSTFNSTGESKVGAGGVSSSTGQTTYSARSTRSDTSSSATYPTTSFSGEFSFGYYSTGTQQTIDDTGNASVVSTTVSRTRTFTWPSTTTTSTQTGTTSTQSTSTKTCITAATDSSAGTGATTTAGTNSYSVSDTTITTATTSSSAPDHQFAPIPHTIVHPNAAMGILSIYNDAHIWVPKGIVPDTQTGFWGDFYSSLASGSASTSVDVFSTRMTRLSVEWQTWSLSTETTTFSATTTTQTGPATSNSSSGTQVSDSVRSSLNGVVWDQVTGTASSVFTVSPLIASQTRTTDGDITLTEWTYTQELTSRNTQSQLTRVTTTETWYFGQDLTLTWETWNRSFTRIESVDVPASTTTGVTFQSYSTNGYLLGTATITSQAWRTSNHTFSVTDYDNQTNAVLIGIFSDTYQTVSSTNTTSRRTAITIEQTWNRTDYTETFQVPQITPASSSWFSMYPRVWQRVLPNGYLGFGGGFSISSPVYAGISSALISGDSNTTFHLEAADMPKFIYRPNASIFATDKCWTRGGALSDISATWLGSETAARTSASLARKWTEVVGSGTSTTVTIRSATYGFTVTGSIGGDYFSEYLPWLNTDAAFGIGRPYFSTLSIDSAGGPAAGIAPVSTAAETLTLLPGKVEMSWATDSFGGSSYTSYSTSSGEFTVSIPSNMGAVVLSYEELMFYSWVTGSALPFESAKVWNLPDASWQSDLD